MLQARHEGDVVDSSEEIALVFTAVLFFALGRSQGVDLASGTVGTERTTEEEDVLLGPEKRGSQT